MVDEVRTFPLPGKNHEPKEVELKSGPNTFSVQLTSSGAGPSGREVAWPVSPPARPGQPNRTSNNRPERRRRFRPIRVRIPVTNLAVPPNYHLPPAPTQHAAKLLPRAPAAVPPDVPARRRRRAGPAAARCDAAGVGRGQGRRPAADGGHRNEHGHPAAVLLPREGRPRLRAHAVPREARRRTATRSPSSPASAIPGVTGGHAAEKCFLTGTPHPERGGFRNWVSLDQFAAEQIGNRTRYPSLVLGDEQRRATDAELHPQRRTDPGRAQPEEAVPEAVRAGQAGGGRRQRRGAAPGPQHARLRRRPVASG